MKDKGLYIVHILDAARDIESFIQGITLQEFLKDKKLQHAVARNLEIIGEAAKRLDPEIIKKVDVPWNGIKGMRDKIAHDYFDIDLQIVWKSATEDVPELKKKLLPYNPE